MRALLVVLVLAVAGCPCPDESWVFLEDFEYCDDLCGWEVAGEGTARRVSTIHPGEHGVELVDWVQVSFAASINLASAYDPAWLELVSSCPGTPRLDAAPTQDGYELRFVLPPGSDAPPAEFRVQQVTLPRASIADGNTYTIAVANQYGRCVIDEIRVTTPAYCY